MGEQTTCTVGCHLELAADGEAVLAFQVAVADGPQRRDEELTITVDGAPARDVTEVATAVGGRLHIVSVARGQVVLDYTATVAPAAGRLPEPTLEEQLVATRPSRFVDSDRLFAVASAELGGLAGVALASAASDWVRGRLTYVPGSSRPTDGATDTLLAGEGVCRDYAHLVAGLLRARDVPARVVAVYAPGLEPMDFHAVAEAWLDGAWHVLDATGLAPRQSLVRIATGRDTADTAFLTSTGPVRMGAQTITAVAGPGLPVDDGGLVRLA